MLQQARFDRRLADPATRPKLLVILHAMVVAATRYVDPTCIPGPLPTPAEREQTRSWVMSTAMSALVIESLQALTIIAFNDIGNGEAMRAWAIIGSLTRTAEYLQLTVEQDGQDEQGTPDRASLSAVCLAAALAGGGLDRARGAATGVLEHLQFGPLLLHHHGLEHELNLRRRVSPSAL